MYRMYRFSHIALSALVLLSIVTGATAQEGTTLPSDSLPPIFAKGNKVLLEARTVTKTLNILEVRGDWVLVNTDNNHTPAWIHPTSTDGSWSLVKQP